MTWRMETGRRGGESAAVHLMTFRKKRRGKEGRGRTEREIPGPNVIHFEGTAPTGITSPL